MAVDLKKGEKLSLDKKPITAPQGKTAKQNDSGISPASKSGDKKTGNGPLKPILIIAGIILLIVIIWLLLRHCGSSSAEGPDQSTQTGEQNQSAQTETQVQSSQTEKQSQSSQAESQGQSAQTVKEDQSTQTASTDIQTPPVTSVPPTLPKTVFPEKTEILFVANSSALLPSASVWLNKTAGELSNYIKQNPDATFKIIGYAAVVYGPPDPGRLSLERANKIVSELRARNINASKLHAISGGETNRWGNNIDETNRSPNRRIVIQQE